MLQRAIERAGRMPTPQSQNSLLWNRPESLLQASYHPTIKRFTLVEQASCLLLTMVQYLISKKLLPPP